MLKTVRTERRQASPRQAQWAPPPPHRPAMGTAASRPFEPPTIPGLDSNFSRFALWHAGHSAVRSAVTNASNSLSHSAHLYSKMGMDRLYSDGSGSGCAAVSMHNRQNCSAQDLPTAQYYQVATTRHVPLVLSFDSALGSPSR